LDITYVIPIDPGAAGKAYARSLQQKIAETGRHVVLHPVGNKSKLIRFRPFASVCQSGAVSYVLDEWNTWLFDELEQFLGDGKQHDDALDAAVSAFWHLNQGITLPDFKLPDLSGSPLPVTLPSYSGNFFNQAGSAPTLPSFNL
jgi:phage terminase large subunit-like protein